MLTFEEKTAFIELLLQQQVLQFGDFILKSGRKSPYLFNLGLFNTGARLAQLGDYYARFIHSLSLDYDMLFGPAYKGIPLVCATSIALANHFKCNLPFCFNRKLKKDYADVSELVGAPLQGKVIMLDDVITAGTTVREMVPIMERYQAKLVAIVIAFDRQEKGQKDHSALQDIMNTYQVPIYSLITLTDLINYLQQHQQWQNQLLRIRHYQTQFGA